MSTLTAVTQTLLYVASTGLQLAVGLSYREQDAPWFPCIVGVILLTQMILTVWSLIWIYKKMDFQDSLLAEATCVLAHVLQLGPIWRCLKIVITKDHKDVKELHMLYLALGIVRDAPFVVLQVFLMVRGRDSDELTMLGVSSVVVTFLAVCMAHAVTGHGKRKRTRPRTSTATSSIADTDGPQLKDCICWMLHFVYRVLVLASRCLAFGLFVDTAGWWLALIVVLHISIHWSMTVILKRTRLDSADYTNNSINILGQGINSPAVTRYHLVSLVEVFDLVSTRSRYHQRDTLEIITFYCIVALQNATMAVLWFLKVGFSLPNTAVFGTVLGSFLLGASVCVLRLSCTHRVDRVVFRQASVCVSASPFPVQIKGVLMPSPILDDHKQHPQPQLPQPEVSTTKETYQNAYDNKTFEELDNTDCEMARTDDSQSPTSVSTPGEYLIDHILSPWSNSTKETTTLEDPQCCSDWKESYDYNLGLGSGTVLHNEVEITQLSKSTICCSPEGSPGGATVLKMDAEHVAPSDDSALDKSCNSGVLSAAGDNTSRTETSECKDCCCEEKLTIRDTIQKRTPVVCSIPKPKVKTPSARTSWGLDTVSCTTCTTTARLPGLIECTACSRTYCSQCGTFSDSSSDTGLDWAGGDNNTWTGTWPPRRKMALNSLSSLQQQQQHPINPKQHVLKWLDEIQVAAVSQSENIVDSQHLPIYPVYMLDRLTEKEPVALRTDSYVQATKDMSTGQDLGVNNSHPLQAVMKFKDLISKLCRAQNSDLCDELSKRRNTFSGADMRNIAKSSKAKDLQGQESVI